MRSRTAGSTAGSTKARGWIRCSTSTVSRTWSWSARPRMCVKETVLDALGLAYHVRVPVEATRPVERQPGDGEAVLETMAAAGAELLDR
jgi:hypothetical protein